MGYSTSPEMIINEEEFLDKLLTVVKDRKSLRISVPRDGNVSTEQYRLRCLLAATDRHPYTLDGRFAGLGASLTIKVSGTHLLVIPKLELKVRMIVRPNEDDALTSLEHFTGSMQLLEFEPSKDFSEEIFQAALQKIGWELHISTRRDSPNGGITFAVERIEERERSAFDILEDIQDTP